MLKMVTNVYSDDFRAQFCGLELMVNCVEIQRSCLRPATSTHISTPTKKLRIPKLAVHCCSGFWGHLKVRHSCAFFWNSIKQYEKKWGNGTKTEQHKSTTMIIIKFQQRKTPSCNSDAPIKNGTPMATMPPSLARIAWHLGRPVE